MSTADIVITAVLAAAVLAAVIFLIIRRRQSGGCGSCNCEGCPHAQTCHRKKNR